jgi:hypothetical protein
VTCKPLGSRIAGGYLRPFQVKLPRDLRDNRLGSYKRAGKTGRLPRSDNPRANRNLHVWRATPSPGAVPVATRYSAAHPLGPVGSMNVILSCSPGDDCDSEGCEFDNH